MKQQNPTHVEGMYPVSAHPTAEGWVSTGIDFADYSRMSTQTRKQSGERRLATPTWAVNDSMLRELLTCFQEERAGFRRKQSGTLPERLARANAAITNQRPRRIEVLTKLCRQYVHLKRFGAYPDMGDEELLMRAEEVFGNRPLLSSDPSGFGAREFLQSKFARDWEIEIEGIDTYLRITNGAGAGAPVLASIVYLYYRVGLDSVGVGAELGLKPPHVRQTLWRLFDTANKLWPDTTTSASKDGPRQPRPTAHKATGCDHGTTNPEANPSSKGVGLAGTFFEGME